MTEEYTMELKDYSLEILNNHCMPGVMSVNAIARLTTDIGCVVPYLNSSLGGAQCTENPPSVTFKTEGKLISVQEHAITVNGVENEAQARKIIDWMIREINNAWQNRLQIVPSYTTQSSPSVLEVLKFLPKTNCRECGAPTCMVFAVQAAEGAKDEQQCPGLTEENRLALHRYLAQFTFN